MIITVSVNGLSLLKEGFKVLANKLKSNTMSYIKGIPKIKSFREVNNERMDRFILCEIISKIKRIKNTWKKPSVSGKVEFRSESIMRPKRQLIQSKSTNHNQDTSY